MCWAPWWPTGRRGSRPSQEQLALELGLMAPALWPFGDNLKSLSLQSKWNYRRILFEKSFIDDSHTMIE